MGKHEYKHCPRCDARFECKVNNIWHCFCQWIELDREVTTQIAEQYEDCLCPACLIELSRNLSKKT